MKYGAGWVVYEDSYRRQSKQLVSVISPKRSQKFVEQYLEQLCVDRYGSIREQLEYKKSRKAATYAPMIHGSVMHCGHEPHLVAVYAHSLVLREKALEFTYRILTRRPEGSDPAQFEERQQHLPVDA